ncbi:hypothetical protein D3C75_1309310 [compost metagenome]
MSFRLGNKGGCVLGYRGAGFGVFNNLLNIIIEIDVGADDDRLAGYAEAIDM